ncbi:MAG TPA: FimV/HubP family polar landmark protein [Steroidobacteraceae bacterium]|nr:FimV/HubP family polar landmark protein [Steroidobacteraceae bacterium]
MRTAVRRVLLMSALMSPGALYALGLGEIHLNSALNQPFDAEIELVSAAQEDLGALRAALASTDTFTRYGLDRPGYLSDFSFRVAKSTGGRDVLRVTSPRPVTEPFVTLLVEANWPRGRLLREYTVLLDPPVFTAAAPSAPVAAPRVSSGGATSVRAVEPVAQATAPTPAAAPATPRAAAPAESAPTLQPGDTYRVRPNDTLYRIASQVNPGTRGDVNRAMVSIYQNNPDAFDGNINLLRSGSTLRLPDASQIQAISASAAAAEVKQQYDAWRSGAAPAAGTDAGRLRLVTPEQGSSAPSTAVASAAGTSAAAPRPSTTGTAASGDVTARVQQLEAELAEARRLLEVRNAELATLQGGTAPAPATEAPVPAPESSDATAAAAAAPAAAVAEEQAKPAEPAKPAKKSPVAEPAGPTLLERAQEYWWVLLGLLGVGLVVTLVQRMRRERGSAEDSLEEALGRPDLRSTPKYTPRARESDSFVVEEKRPVEPVRAVASAAVAAATPRQAEPAPARKTVTVEDTLSGDSLGSTESSDPLAEADFHMAYGLYDQAADLVQLAIKREPQRRELKLKLLEIFFVWGNRERFLEQARDLHATRGDAPAGEWDKVLIMGKQIAPEESIFAGTPSGSDMLDMELHGAAATLDLDVTELRHAHSTPDLDLTEGDGTATDAAGLDFILDDEPGDAGSSQVAPTIETPRVRAGVSTSDTQELTVDDLGIDVDALRDLESLDIEDTLAASATGVRVEDTVETRAARPVDHEMLDDEQDVLTSTAMLSSLDDSTALIEPGMIDLSEATGEVTQLDTSATGITRRVNFDTGEPPTMSEVGTKLDLARAYMDMGDPEGARSILDEVLQEGNVVQKQEAQRLIASLP